MIALLLAASAFKLTQIAAASSSDFVPSVDGGFGLPSHHHASRHVAVKHIEQHRSHFDEPSCPEVLWCNATAHLQHTILSLQNPGPDGCNRAKFLVYDPPNYGIGSTIHLTAMVLGTALCTGRILYLHAPKDSPYTSWRSPGCDVSSMECYFERLTSCRLDEHELDSAPYINATNFAALQDTRIVRAQEYGEGLPCGFCAPNDWKDLKMLENLRADVRQHFVGSELPMMAQLARYVVRPLPHFDQRIRDFLRQHMDQSLVRPFASMHVRYGDKHSEAPRVGLDVYMSILRQKGRHIKTVFLSTETEEVIANLTRWYPKTNFAWIKYQRIEENGPGSLTGGAQEREMIASMANLYVATQADFFIGSLTSNWCRLIHELERTRGDAGYDYYSVDSSQHSHCFG